MSEIFSKLANDNIARTGNVWGHDFEYDYRFRIKLPFKYYASFEQKKSGQFMGRFGGGWNYVLGIQISGNTIIINLFIMSIRIGRERENQRR